MIKKRFFGIIGVLIAIVTVLAGCEAAPPASSSSGQLLTGSLRVSITDAPPKAEIVGVWLTITGIKIHLAGNEAVPQVEQEREQAQEQGKGKGKGNQNQNQNQNQAQELPEVNGGWMTLELAQGIAGTPFNLLNYQNGLQQLLAGGTLAAGKYTQIRMEVEKVEVELKDTAKKEPAKLPSNTLKFVHPFEIVGGGVTEIIFDFDALKSINVQGNGQYMCKPVIKITSVHPVLTFNTAITSDLVKLPGSLATDFTITTAGVPGTMHTLGLIDTVSTPALADGDYAFSLVAEASQKTGLKSYFAAKAGWTPAMLAQINDQIDGTKPFFFLRAAGGVYTLVDNFKLFLATQIPGYSETNLTIDDDYLVGTYVYTGTLKGINNGTLAVTVTLKVQRSATP